MQQINPTSINTQVQPAPVSAPAEPAPEEKGKRQCFVNDLTPEEREKAVAEYTERIREQLSGETISVNCMSRLLNIAHPRVAAMLSITNSAREALLDTSTNKVVRAKSLLQKLSDEQRKLLMEQLKNEPNS